MAGPRKVKTPRRPLFAALAGVVLPVWTVRALGCFALVVAFVTPTVAERLGWLKFDRSEVGEQPEPQQEPLEALRPRLIWLPGGTFLMGSPEGEGATDEHPQHEVTISRFAMCETEVSLRQYELVRGVRPLGTHIDGDDHPVRYVTWEDAVRYLNGLTRLENRARGSEFLTECYDEDTWVWDQLCTGYRLPTEAEWEYAARAGTKTRYFFGDDEEKICSYANVLSNNCNDGYETLAPVKTEKLKPNLWGLHGMGGNMSEWVNDWYYENMYEYAKSQSEKVNLVARGRVLRGGSFNESPSVARSANRLNSPPATWFGNYGFRCARGSPLK